MQKPTKGERITQQHKNTACSDRCSCDSAAESPFDARNAGNRRQQIPTAGTLPQHDGQDRATGTAPGARRVAAGIGRTRLNAPHAARISIAAILLLAGLWRMETALPATLFMQQTFRWVLFLGAYLLVGWPVIRSAARNIVGGRIFDEMFLMTIATAGAFAIGELPEAVAVMLFYSVGEYFQELAVGRSRRSIAELMDLRPEFARLVTESGVDTVEPDHVEVGSIIEILPGDRIPLDGTVVDGESSLDTSALTGESVPRAVSVGDSVLAGFVNDAGRLRLHVARPFGESSVSRVLDLVQHAAEKKAPTERFITRFAAIYTPIVVGIAAALALIPPLLVPGAAFSDWLYRALVVLVISCPCALVVSVPMGYFGGIGSASRNRVLVKGANYLDALNQVGTVVFDKTGTLTRGVFAVTDVIPRNGYSGDDLLRLVAHAETGSTHPIARAVRQAYSGTVDPEIVSEIREEKGFGIHAFVDGHEVIAGGDRLLQRERIPHADCDATGTTVYAAIDGVYAGLMLVSDELKPEAAEAVLLLRELGISRIVMLTGDNHAIASEVAQRLGINEVYGQLLPEEKVTAVEQLQSELPAGRTLAFAGDGINDAPVLMRADIGIAMGGIGSDAAIEAADVVLMDDAVDRVPVAIEIARRTRTIVRENIVFAMGAKALFIALGAAGLAGMWMAVIGDVGVSLLAVLNATRTLRFMRP